MCTNDYDTLAKLGLSIAKCYLTKACITIENDLHSKIRNSILFPSRKFQLWALRFLFRCVGLLVKNTNKG